MVILARVNQINMKQTLFIILSFLSSFSLLAQDKKACSCFQIFAEELDKIEKESVLDLSEHIGNKFHQLKRDNPQFKACADFYNLEFNMWTLGKLRIMLGLSSCEISKKARAMLEEGPMIYEMNFELEKQIKDQHKSAIYQQFTDSSVIERVLTESNRFMQAGLESNIEEYLKYLPDWYIDFIGREEMIQYLIQTGNLMDSLQLSFRLKAPIAIPSLLQNDSVLSTLIVHPIVSRMNDKVKESELKVLAISEDNAASWKYISLNKQKIRSFWALNNSIDPIALENKLNSEGATKYAAKNGAELGAHFCDCAKDVDPDDFMKVMACTNILIKHPLWKGFEIIVEVHNYVKEHCEQHKDAFIFMGVNKLDKK